jgi:tetratricopeptide (TPR) repeat protein
MAMLGGAALAILIGLVVFRHIQRNAALAEAIASAKAAAMAPIARRSQVANLAETPQDIKSECERDFSEDPLTSYYRAEELIRLDPGDPAAAQLLERARERMAQVPPVGSEKDLDRSIKDGDLETARNALGDLLRRTPDDPELKAKARTVYLALVQVQASAERFQEARDTLRQGRAMFPQDKAWAARLRLLEEIQAMGKGSRATWIPLLG